MNHDSETNPSKKIAPPLGVDRISWPEIRTESQLKSAAEILQNGGRIYPTQGKKSEKF